MTIADVAKHANVSRTAVSFALNDPSRLAAATVEQILKVADELGYVRNPAARMLRTQKTHALGILFPQPLDQTFENPYYTQFLRGVGQTCQREGYTVLLVPPLRGSMIKAIPYAAVDGFIVSGLETDRGEIAALRQRRVPFVLVDSEPLDGVPSVEIDEAEAMKSVLTHLIELGHRRIGVLAFSSGVSGGPAAWRGPLARRMAGIEEACREVADVELLVEEVECSRQGGVDGFRRVWAESAPPSAIVTFSDVIAYGVLDAAHHAGVAVPEELSVTGFDDLPDSQWTQPSLTTVRQSIETKGRLAADHLVEAFHGSTRTEHDRLHAALVVRGSSGPRV